MFDLSTVLLIALKTSLLIAIAGAAAALLARASAAHRHLMWMVALGLALIMPFAILCLPANAIVPVPWLGAQPAAAAYAAVAGVEPGTTGDAWPSLSSLLLVWAGGVLALLLRDGAAHFGLLRWAHNAKTLHSPNWLKTLADVAATHELPRRLTVLESAHVGAPCTWGVFRPVLLLPEAGSAWNADERHHAVLHELAHIRRHDYLSALAARIACAVHWYNPFVWFAASQVLKLQEQACDDAVLRAGGRPSQYAQLLLHIAGQGSMTSPARAAVGMSGSALRGRVVAILNPRNHRVEPGVFVILGVMLVLSALMLFIATAAAAPPEPAPVILHATPATPAVVHVETERNVTVTVDAPHVAVTRERYVERHVEVHVVRNVAAHPRHVHIDVRIMGDHMPVPPPPPMPAMPAIAPMPDMPPMPPMPDMPAVPPTPDDMSALPAIPPVPPVAVALPVPAIPAVPAIHGIPAVPPVPPVPPARRHHNHTD